MQSQLRMARVWQSFADSLSAKQQADMHAFGYTLLDAPQYKVLYGPQGVRVCSGAH
jgi:hypothetical protein